MRRVALLLCISASLLVGRLQAKPFSEKKEPAKTEKTSLFKPVEISNELNDKDPQDPQLNQPSKKFTVKLTRDKTYVIWTGKKQVSFP